MKNKILYLIIGILIGAIITTTGFLIYNKTLSNNQPEMMQMNGNGQNAPPSNGNMGQPPSKPDGNQEQNSGTPPEMPSNSNSKDNI